MPSILVNKWTKRSLFLVCLVPFGILLWESFTGNLGPNPVETLQHTTGDWTLRFLVITLSITPLRKLLKLPDLIRFRRMLGLFAFFYACLHFLVYLGPDQNFDLASMWKDVYKRPFITVGFTAFVLLIPLALTSTAGWVRRLGGRRWRILHRAIYICAVCGVIHYYWMVKSAVLRPLAYGAIVALLLLWRLGDWLIRRGRAIPTPAKAQSASAND
ncbi:MAG: protein-methionine-sulfoxide reductase heme-binding subunit MsrQ [Candidatus Acidiferrum sp.]